MFCVNFYSFYFSGIGLSHIGLEGRKLIKAALDLGIR